MQAPPDPDSTEPPGSGSSACGRYGGEIHAEETEDLGGVSDVNLETAVSQGYRTEDEEDISQNFLFSMVELGWQNDELRSDRWAKIEDQPAVRIMTLVKQEEETPPGSDKGDQGKKVSSAQKDTMTYCVSGVSKSKQKELVEASFQLRARILEVNAFTFSAIPLEMIPLDVAYVSTLSLQEVPDYFAGQQWRKQLPKSHLTWTTGARGKAKPGRGER